MMDKKRLALIRLLCRVSRTVATVVPRELLDHIDRQAAEIERLTNRLYHFEQAHKEQNMDTTKNLTHAYLEAEVKASREAIVSLKAEIDRLRTALAWYADRNNWTSPDAHDPEVASAASVDGGDRATAALAADDAAGGDK